MIFHKDRFRYLREQKGLSMRAMARACGVGSATVSRWETMPRFQPSPHRIPRLAAVLGCAESEIATYGDGRQNDVSPHELRELAKLMQQLALKFEMIAGREA